MSDTNPAEKPVNDGGTTAEPNPPDAETLDAEAISLAAEKPANQGGS